MAVQMKHLNPQSFLPVYYLWNFFLPIAFFFLVCRRFRQIAVLYLLLLTYEINCFLSPGKEELKH